MAPLQVWRLIQISVMASGGAIGMAGADPDIYSQRPIEENTRFSKVF